MPPPVPPFLTPADLTAILGAAVIERERTGLKQA
jgi:hypothetical protein